MGLALTAAELTFQASTTPPGELDPAVLERCRQGDRLALRLFVNQYQRSVFAFLSRMTGSGTHVEDLAQEVFLRAYRALPRYEARAGVRVSTWLLTIAARLVLDDRKRRRPLLVPLSEHLATDEPTPESVRHRREILEAFERAAAQLADEQRVVFVLAQFHGLTMAQIAAAVGATEGTVKTRLHRARSRLRELMSETQEIDES
jgi:RNA polymerase sigma-70 factor (ECF subfamily)